MADIRDYLRWRGDLTFAERPLNDVDNLVLSALVYLDFTGVVPDELQGGSVTLADACVRLFERGEGDIAPFVRSLAHVDTELVKLACSSRRFCDARLAAYADVVDEDRSLQFCAVEVDLPEAGVYVAFRGTDNTLVGWRENFMLSFEVTQAQREAAGYLARAVRRASYANKPVWVGGHSKGGNLAEFAAMSLDDDMREHIARVFSNDGPGMAPEVMPYDGRALLGSKLRRIVPTYSVVGMIFARESDPCAVVKSSGTGIVGEHDLTTWQVLYDTVEEADGLLPESRIVNEALAKWTKGVSLEERKRITAEMFDALESGGATSLDEIAATPEGLQKVLHSLRTTDDRTRETVMALVQTTLDGSVEAVRKAARKAIGDAAKRWPLLPAHE